MKFYADECLNQLILEHCRGLGLDVERVPKESEGKDDPEVLSDSVARQRVLLTEDKDFGGLVLKDLLPTTGVILFRYDRKELDLVLYQLELLFKNHLSELDTHFVVTTASGYRIRKIDR